MTAARTFRVAMPRKQGARCSLLYIRYRDMRSRAHGRGTKCPWVYPLGWPSEWNCFETFRAWALAHGFSKTNNSPDRPRPTEPYGPDNVVWVPGVDNFGRSRGKGYYGSYNDDAVRGQEPPSYFEDDSCHPATAEEVGRSAAADWERGAATHAQG